MYISSIILFDSFYISFGKILIIDLYILIWFFSSTNSILFHLI